MVEKDSSLSSELAESGGGRGVSLGGMPRKEGEGKDCERVLDQSTESAMPSMCKQ